MLSHDNLAWTAQLLLDIGGRRTDDVSLSYLPLSHIAEQMFTIHMPATAGCDRLLRRVDREGARQPQGGRGRPCSSACRASGRSSTRARRPSSARRPARRSASLAWARRRVRRGQRRCATAAEPMPRLLAAQYRLADRLVIGKLKAALGLDRVRDLFSGAAPIAPDVLEFFASLDLPIREIYGQSEDYRPDVVQPASAGRGSARSGRRSPASRSSSPTTARSWSAGRNVFLGYYKEPEATAETLRDGWLCSGDLGAFDARRLPDDHRPQEGDHHHRRRQEHRAEEHRGRAQAVAARRRGGRDRRPPQVPDRAGHARRGRRAQVAATASSTARSRSAPRSRSRSTRSTRRSRASSRSRSSRSCRGRSGSTPASSRRR